MSTSEILPNINTWILYYKFLYLLSKSYSIFDEISYFLPLLSPLRSMPIMMLYRAQVVNDVWKEFF